MAVRIRSNGRILCAAQHPACPGDAYLDDDVHYELSVERRVLVTEPMSLPDGGGHAAHGEWWWKGQEPNAAHIDPFYYEENNGM